VAEGADLWRVITPIKRSRSFICGSTGSGKSTLGAALLEQYHRYYPAHHLLIVDPKRRFFAAPEDHPARLFPDGYTASPHGRREGVSVAAEPLHEVGAWHMRHPVLVVQDDDRALDAMSWLYRHADVRKPWMVYVDEAHHFQSIQGRAFGPLGTLISEGREIGIGLIAIHQRPRRLDVGHISEAQRLYIGTLHNADDRIHLARTVALPNPERLREPMPLHTFMLANQTHPAQSFMFKIGVRRER
jgi:hypothetical protein